MFRTFPLFRLIVDEVEKTLPLVDLAIARRFAGLVPDQALRDDIFGMVEAEYGRTVLHLLRVTGETALLDRFPNHRGRLDSRLPMLNRASLRQVDLLRRVRSRPPGADAGEDLVPLLLSINCVAAGLGWTG
jgi:phosphoenolpyruvate carboxylase